MRKAIDLTLPIIVGHWRYSNQRRPVHSIADGDASNVTYFDLQTHMFTHIDAPKHVVADGKTLDDFPVDLCIGKAAVLDVSYVKPNQGIGAEDLEKAYQKCEKADIILVKTSWGLHRDWTSKEFWDDAPYITEDGAKFLLSISPKVVGYDFPQDYDIRRLRTVDEHECDLTTHRYLLKNEILMIEYMTNMWEITGNNVDFVGLPLKLDHADGAQIRCVALEER